MFRRQQRNNVIYWRCGLPLPVSFLVSLSPFKTQSPYPQSLLEAQILAKKVQLYSYQENAFLDITKRVQKKRWVLIFMYHVSTQPGISVPSALTENCIISPDLQFYLGLSALVAWASVILFKWFIRWIHPTEAVAALPGTMAGESLSERYKPTWCPTSVLFSEVTRLHSVSFAHTTADTKAISDLQHYRAVTHFLHGILGVF